MPDSTETGTAGGGALREVRLWLRDHGTGLLGAVVAVATFLFSVQLLGTATEAAAPLVRDVLLMVVVDEAAALGTGWLVTYALTNGSVVAALSLSLLSSDLVSASQAFLLVAGSRLGGGAIVVLVGAADYWQRRGYRSLSEGTSLGLLTFLVTLSVYVPATVLGVVALPLLQPAIVDLAGGFGQGGPSLRAVAPFAGTITDVVGPQATFVLAVGLLFGSLRLLDRVLAGVETEALRTHLFTHFDRRWTAFGIGVVITVVTTSVAFSLGVVVPLYNRGFVKRSEMVPYILGANVGTLFDTLVVAVVLQSPVGVAIVLALVGTATILTLLVLVVYDPYYALVDGWQDVLLEDRRLYAAFAALLVAVPLGLLLVPHL